MTTLLPTLTPLIAALKADGYTVIGPAKRGEAIVLTELDSADDLPHGWGVTLEAGSYRLRRRDDSLAFGHSAGPQSWKTYLHPPKVPLWTVRREGFEVSEPPPDETRYAFIGVRPCDLRAIAVQDRVLGGPGSRHAQRRATTFIVAVDCTEPGETCFCVSAGGGPACGAGADLRLTELDNGTFLAHADTPAGTALLQRLPQRPAAEDEARQGQGAVASAAGKMGRQLPPLDFSGRTREAAHWDDIAQRCLSCGNCTMVCPTCFCTTVTDTSDLTGQVAQRWQSWDSCFDLDFSYLHGGPVRSSTRSRYRQWLSHKLGTWHDQFGESGCVGCGRCIVWCPAGIDITAETRALAQEVNSDDQRA